METFPVSAFLLCALLWGWELPSIGGNFMPEYVPSLSAATIRVKEDTPPGSVIHTFVGKDSDKDKLTFYIPTGIYRYDKSLVGMFEVQRVSKTSANLTLLRALDREERSEYFLDVHLTDNRTRKPNIQQLIIIVVDVNDNYPLFEAHYNDTFNISENSGVPKLLATFFATDVDEGPNAEVSYALRGTKSGDLDYFEIITNEKDEGVLSLVRPLDFENASQHVIRVIARDNPSASQGEARKETEINVTIDVTDVNDSPPQFLPVPEPGGQVYENAAVGSPVVTIQAVDGDRNVLRPVFYGLCNEKDMFSIDENDGQITTKFPYVPDGALVGSYTLVVRATEVWNETNCNSTGRGALESNVTSEMQVLIKIKATWGRPHFRNGTLIGQIPENSAKGAAVPLKRGLVAEVYDHDMDDRDLIKLTLEGDAGTFGVMPDEGYAQLPFQIVVEDPTRLDYENLREIHFYVVATDSGGNRTRIAAFVFITDLNDNSPLFRESPLIVKVPETPWPGLLVATVQARDNDSGLYGEEGLRYGKLRGMAERQLKLNEISGEITVASFNGDSDNCSDCLAWQDIFDREKHPEIYMSVEVRDKMGTGNGATLLLILQLVDENDNGPQFSQSRYEAVIYENEQNIRLPLRVFAFDEDQPGLNNSRVEYTLQVGTDNPGWEALQGYLDIGAGSGALFLKRGFDFEKLSQTIPLVAGLDPELPLRLPIYYTIHVRDLGNPPQRAKVPLTVYLIDRNDCAPEFEQVGFNVTLEENTPAPYELARVVARDQDLTLRYSTVVYSVSAVMSSAGATQDFSRFKVDSRSGVVTLEGGLDYSWEQEYSVRVSCSDVYRLKATQEVTIQLRVTDVNNKAPIFTHKTKNSSQVCPWNEVGSANKKGFFDCFSANIPESSLPGVNITRVSASDEDSTSDLRYHLGDYGYDACQGEVVPDLKSYLEIDPKTGVITTGRVPLDYETRSLLRVPLMVEDVAGKMNTPQVAKAWLLLNITNVNDLPPTFVTRNVTATIKENSPVGTPVLSVSARGEDPTVRVFYTMDDADTDSREKAPFEVDSATGVIRVNGEVDREHTEWYNLSITASTRVPTTDKLVNASLPVYIQLEDVNDIAPVFTDSVQTVSVMENSAVGTLITGVHAVDPDQTPFPQVGYLLDGNFSQGEFSMDFVSGSIRVSGKIDREKRDRYTLNVTAIDNYPRFCTGKEAAKGSISTSKIVQVFVEDANDHQPDFHFFFRNDVEVWREKGEIYLWDNITVDNPVLTFYLTDDDLEGTLNAATTVRVIPNEDEDMDPLFKIRNEVADSNSSERLVLATTRPFIGFDGNYTVILHAEDKGIPPQIRVEYIYFQVQSLNPLSKSVLFIKPRYKAVLTPGYLPDTLLTQVGLTGPGFNKSGDNYPVNLTFTIKPRDGGASPPEQYPLNELFSINATTGKVFNRLEVNGAVYQKEIYLLLVSIRWKNKYGFSAKKHTNLTVYMVRPSQKVHLLSRLSWRDGEYGIRKSYQLGGQLELLFGVLVVVESRPEIIAHRNLSRIPTSNLLLKVTLIYPGTDEVLDRWEVLHLFDYTVRDLHYLLRPFKVITSFTKLREEGYQFSAEDLPTPTLWQKIRAFFSNSWNVELGALYQEHFSFKSAREVYTYCYTGAGVLLLFQILLVTIFILLQKMFCRDGDEAYDRQRIPTTQLNYDQLFIRGKMKLPEEVRQRFLITLDNDVGEGGEGTEYPEGYPEESEC